MEASADYYAILGVGADAEGSAIRVAYRNLMRRYHPDVNASDEAAARATAINEAYGCLGDPDRRAAYDRRRRPRPSMREFAATSTSARPQRPAWRRQHVYMAEIEPEPAPLRWNLTSLGLAALVTLITFALTSATPPPVPLPPEPVITVQAETGGQTLRGPKDRPCDPRSNEAEKPCVTDTAPPLPK